MPTDWSLAPTSLPRVAGAETAPDRCGAPSRQGADGRQGEELFEVLSWAMLGLHAKPCGLLNTAGYYQPLIEFLAYAVSEDFLKPKHRALLTVEDQPEDLLERIDEAISPEAAERFDAAKT